MNLAVRFRPRVFSEVVGNKEVISTIQDLAKSNHPPQTWAFYGSSGIGKTTIARIIARGFGATSAGIFENNCANFRGIDAMRGIIDEASRPVLGSPVKVYILDECHQLTKEAQNSLLKILEDTPKKVIFILLTTDPNKLIKAIRNRCKEFSLKDVGRRDLNTLIDIVSDKEDIHVSNEIKKLIIQSAKGSPRMALNILEKVQDVDSLKEAEVLCDQIDADENSDNLFNVYNLFVKAVKTSDSSNLVKELKSRWWGDNAVDFKGDMIAIINIAGSMLCSKPDPKVARFFDLLNGYDSLFTKGQMIIKIVASVSKVRNVT